MTERIDPNESRMFAQIQELCTLCAQGIVKISDDTGYPPKFVTETFVDTFQHILKKMEDSEK